MSIQFGLYLIDQQVITHEDFTETMRDQLGQRLPVGQVALRRRLLSLTQVFTILRRQSECSSPFGRIACDLGFLDETELAEVLFYQSEMQPPFDSLLVKRGVLTEKRVPTTSRGIPSSNQLSHQTEPCGPGPSLGKPFRWR